MLPWVSTIEAQAVENKAMKGRILFFMGRL
jgi:hypothetical protein